MNSISQQPVVLLAESDAVIGMDLSDALEKAGYRVLGPVSTIAEALALLEQDSPALAIIDVALKDGRCTGLARVLRQRSVPFLVHSAARQDQRLTGDFQSVPWLGKPALSADVIAVLQELSASAPAPVTRAPSSEPSASVHLLHPGVAARNPLIRKLEGFTTLSDADRAMLARISAETRRVTPGTDLEPFPPM